MASEFKYELGAKVRDNITGFTGVVTSRTECITGGNRFEVEGGITEEGKPVGIEWVDEDRLVLVQAATT